MVVEHDWKQVFRHFVLILPLRFVALYVTAKVSGKNSYRFFGDQLLPGKEK